MSKAVTFPKEQYFALSCPECKKLLAICPASRMETLSMKNLNHEEQVSVLAFLEEHREHEWDVVLIEFQKIADA